MKQELKFIIHTDGGARGNPGPSAIGVVIEGGGWTARKEYAEFIGEGTNNEAEYKAVIFALKKLKALIGKEKAKKTTVEMHVDSELLAQQLNREYKVLDKKIQALYLEVHNLTLDFGSVIFKHIPREDNRGADKLVNAALNKEASKLL
jgi:ribonuclease HI